MHTTMRHLIALLLMFPVLAQAAATTLVDTIPSGGVFINLAEVNVPFPSLAEADPKEIEAGLNDMMSELLSYAEKNGADYVCLLPLPGSDVREFNVAAAHNKIKLLTRNPSLRVVLYRQGQVPLNPPSYTLDEPGKLEAGQVAVTAHIKKLALPNGWTTKEWIYFNLPSFQDAAMKDGANRIFLTSTGSGASSTVLIPGLDKPMTVFADKAEFSATWYK